jgi:hypothetical protein
VKALALEVIGEMIESGEALAAPVEFLFAG